MLKTLEIRLLLQEALCSLYADSVAINLQQIELLLLSLQEQEVSVS